MMLLILNLKGGPFQTKNTKSIADIIKTILSLVVFDVNYVHISMIACLPQKTMHSVCHCAASSTFHTHKSRLCPPDRNGVLPKSWADKMKQKQSPTSFTGASQVSSPGAITHVAVPALSTDPIVLAGVAQTLFWRLLRARGLHPGCLLDLGQAPDILTLSVNE